MQMGFIEIVFAFVDKVYIIASEIHAQGNVSMVGGIVVHQRHKKANDVNNCRQ